MNLVPGGLRSSSFWKIEGDSMEEGGVEEHRKEGGSLLFRESMTMLVCAGILTVLSPVTLSVEVHWEDVSELSVTVTQHKKNMLKL